MIDDRMMSLIRGYFDMALTETEEAELAAWLSADRRHVEAFVRESFHQHQTATVLEQFELEDVIGNIPHGMVDHTRVLEAVESERLVQAQRTEQEQLRLAHEAQQRDDGKFDCLVANDAFVPARHIVIPKTLFYGAIGAVAAAIALAVMAWLSQGGSSPVIDVAPPDAPAVVAVLAEQVNARWEGSTGSIQTGASIYAEPMRLTEGFARLRFHNGAEAIIEAPAMFEPVSATEMRLVEGRMVGLCATPESRGFTVLGPNARIVDRGTEFGVEATDRGETRAHVFTGHVQFGRLVEGDQPGAMENLRAGAAASVGEADALPQPIALDRYSFVRDDEMSSRVLAAHGDTYHTWRAHLYQLRRNTSRLVYLSAALGSDVERFDASEGFASAQLLRAAAGPIRIEDTTLRYPRLIASTALIRCDEEQAIFLDLRGPLADRLLKANLLDSQGMVDAPGRTIYISWLMRGRPTHAGFAGLSLFDGVDAHEFNQREIFFGVAHNTGIWSWDANVSGKDAAYLGLDFDPRQPGVQTRASDSALHWWVVRIDFRDGPDRMMIYFDPDPTKPEPAVPHAVVEDQNVRFDRLRFHAAQGAGTWWLGDLRIDATFPGSP